LAAERRQVHQQARVEKERMLAERDAVLADLNEKRRSLERRSEHVDQCHAALERSRSELGRMHRETLEIRLAAEELWIRLSDAAPPAALTQSLGQIRAKLADHYRLAGSELAEKKKELEALRKCLAEEHRKLSETKSQLERWAAQRHEEIEQQAKRLLARELEIEQQDGEFRDLARQWQAERLGYQQEIRRLQAQVPDADPAIAP
jgi:uncharacterized protein (DUF3084 family)